MNARYLSVHNVSSSSFQLISLKPNIVHATQHSTFLILWRLEFGLSPSGSSQTEGVWKQGAKKKIHLGENKYKENEGNYTRTSIIIILPPKINRVIKSRTMDVESSVAQIGRMGHAQIFFFLWLCGPTWAMASSFLRFLDHTQRRITVGRTPLDAWSARRRDLYLTTHNTDRHPCPRWDSNPQSQQASGRRPTS